MAHDDAITLGDLHGSTARSRLTVALLHRPGGTLMPDQSARTDSFLVIADNPAA